MSQYVLEKHDLAQEENGDLNNVCKAITSGQTQEIYFIILKIIIQPLVYIITKR